MNKFIAIVFAVVCLKSIQSTKSPKSINAVPYYELEKDYVIKGEKETGQLKINDLVLYEHNKNLEKGKVSIRASHNSYKFYVNESIVLNQNPKKAPIVIIDPHLQAENISSFEINFDDKYITYTMTSS